MNSSAPKITVLMATYNREELVKVAIDSFLAQTYDNKELIICDDCSTDNTVAVISRYASSNSNISFRINASNKGFIRTMNSLFQQAEGDYICILDSDDYIAPNRLTHQLTVLEEHKADAVISEYIQVLADGSLRYLQPKTDMAKVVEPFTDDVFFPSGSLFLKKEVIRHLKGYHDYFANSFCGDIYFINAIAEKYKIIYDPTPVYYYRLTPGSMTQVFNLRKLATVELVKWLIEEREKKGTDALEQGDMTTIDKFLDEKVRDNKWAAEHYRGYASREIDERNIRQGYEMLKTAFRLNPFTLNNARTLFYLLRQSIKRNA